MIRSLIASRIDAPEKTGGVWEPWLTRDAISILEKLLSQNAADVRAQHFGLEWGAGTSTKWLCERVERLYTMEHNLVWGKAVSDHMKQFPELLKKWTLRIEAPSKMGSENYRGRNGLYYEAYARLAPDWSIPGDYDVVLVDGRARSACLQTAVGVLRGNGGILVLDNSQRPYDLSCIPKHWKRTDTHNGRWDTTIWISCTA